MESIRDQPWGSQDFGSWGDTFGVGLVGVRGRSPPDAGEFSKTFKNFLKRIAKNALFLDIFQKDLTNHGLIFRVFKHAKIFTVDLLLIPFFAGLDEKHKLLENFEKILMKIQ